MIDFRTHLKEIQNQISYYFDNVDLLLQAFTRSSYSSDNGGQNNETLEFIGDRVLDFYVTKILIDRYGYIISQTNEFNPNNHQNGFVVRKYNTEGHLTTIKKKLVNQSILANRIDVLGLQDYLFMSKGDYLQKNSDIDSTKADLFEAILGAIAIDSKWNPDYLENSVNVMLSIDNLLDNWLLEDDYVNLVQEWNQKRNEEVPKYVFDDLYDGFHAFLLLNTRRGSIHYEAYGNSKSEARLNVAKKAYNDLKDNNELFSIEDELPDEITIENSINTIQELAQKGYISMPEYDFPDVQVNDNNGKMSWKCTCSIRSNSVVESAYAKSKKMAKKHAAYLVICNIFGLNNNPENNNE